MSISMARTAESAKTETAYPCGNRPRALRLNAGVMRKSRDLFEHKTAHHLADITGYSVRACENWLSEKVVIPSDALAELLRSERGRDFLAVVMADATPRWWKQLKAWVKAVSIATVERQLRRQRREMLNAEFEYEPATSFAQMLFDEDFNGAQVAPARRAHRAVAKRR